MDNQEGLFFPLFINLNNKRIVVFGAGEVAIRRLETLQFFHPKVTVIGKKIKKEYRNKLKDMYTQDKIEILERAFMPEDIKEGIDIVLTATDDKEVNARITSLCKKRKILVNNASDASQCDFYFPAIAINENIIVGIAGNGKDHTKVVHAASKIREYLESE